MASLSDNSLMPFGAHKGRKMIDVPASYLVWLMGELKKKHDKDINVFERLVLNYCIEMEDAFNLELKKKAPPVTHKQYRNSTAMYDDED